MQKRGASHIEIVLSFILFAAAVSFALYFFSPVDSTRLVDSTIIYAFSEVEKSATIDLTEYGIVIDIDEMKVNPPTADPSEDDPVAIHLPDIGEDHKVHVVDKYNVPLPSKYDSGDEQIHIDVPEDLYEAENLKFIKIYTSVEYIEDDVVDTNVIISPDYTEYASAQDREVVSLKEIGLLCDEYKSNYLKVKDDFNLPDRIDFGFTLLITDFPYRGEDPKYDDRSIIALPGGDCKPVDPDAEVPEAIQSITPSGDVFSESKRIEVLDSTEGEEELLYADLRVYVW